MSERERTRNGAPFPDRAAGIGTQKNPLWIRFGWEISCRLSFYLTQQFIRHFSRHTYLWEPSRVASTPPLRAFVSLWWFNPSLHTEIPHCWHTSKHKASRITRRSFPCSCDAPGKETQRSASYLLVVEMWFGFLFWEAATTRSLQISCWGIYQEGVTCFPSIFSHLFTLNTPLCSLSLLIQKRPSRAIKVAAPSYICIILNQNNSAFWEESSILYTTSGFKNFGILSLLSRVSEIISIWK